LFIALEFREFSLERIDLKIKSHKLLNSYTLLNEVLR